MLDYAPQIQQGRACVRLIEAAEMLLAQSLPEEEAAPLREARQFCKARLRVLVGELPPAISAQILAASERIGNAPAGDFLKN